VNCVAFSPDDARLATASNDRTVRLWNARTGEPLGEPLTGHTGSLTCVAFSPDGSRLASASWDQTVRLWDGRTGEPLGEPLTGHTGSVTCLAFSPDGQRLASGSRDRTVRVWDTRTGMPVGAPLTGQTGWVTCVEFSPDGQRMAIADTDQKLRIWPGAAPAEMLCAKLSANMTARQWCEWVSPDIDYVRVCPALPVPQDHHSVDLTPEQRAQSWAVWVPCVDGQAAEILQRLVGVMPYEVRGWTLVNARWSHLSFYEAHRLVELEFVRDRDTARAFVLEGPRHTLWLNGQSTPIHEVNEAEALALTDSTVDDYLRFFFYFVRGDNGPFVIIEFSDQIESADGVGPHAGDDVDTLTLDDALGKARPLLNHGRVAAGHWLIDVTVAYDGDLFGAQMAVQPSGLVEMTDDEPIGGLGSLVVTDYLALDIE
jgi:dipeptidyl aminopeptidase/acylaminoacyl peptidase